MNTKNEFKKIYSSLFSSPGLWLSVFASVLLVLIAMSQSGAIAETTDPNLLVSSNLQAEDVNQLADANQATVVDQTVDVAQVEDTDVDYQANELDVVEEAGDTGTLKFLNFQSDTTLQKGLRLLAAKYRKNIVPSPNVKGNVTVGRLYDVTFKEAMNAMLGYQFKWEDDGRFVWVYTAAEYEKIKMDKQRMVSKVFTLYYINAEEAKKILDSSLSEFGGIAATTPAIKDTKAGDGGDSYAMRDAIVVYDFPERVENIAAMIEEIDQRPPAIMLDVTIMQATLNDQTQLGVDLDNIASGISTLSLNSDDELVGNFSSSASGGLGAVVTIDNVTAFIQALESTTDTTVLANPKIMALNKQAGKLQIGDKKGYATTTQTNADGATQQVEFIDTGTILEFRPFICKDGYVRMEIHPEQSTGVVEAIGNSTLPSQKLTTVMTNIIVKDGQTIVIGGLFQDDITKVRKQIPILGDIPFIGVLFGSVDDKAIRTELIVLITPHIINDPEKIDDTAKLADIDRMVYGAHKSLEWFNRTRFMEDRYAFAVKKYTEGNYDGALADLNYVLDMRPRYEKAMKLREKIISERSGGQGDTLERIMLNKFENEN